MVSILCYLLQFQVTRWQIHRPLNMKRAAYHPTARLSFPSTDLPFGRSSRNLKQLFDSPIPIPWSSHMSRLENLSHIDFEELCRDLAFAETGERFAAFGPGPDGGVDGRHSRGEKTTILQCKHYYRSSFSALKATMRREMIKISELAPTRYVLFTSQSLTTNRSEELAAIMGTTLKSPDDIWGREDIDAAIRRHPSIEKSHIKLWLTSTAVLERVLQSGLEAFSQATKDEILEQIRLYVRNPSFDHATKRLEEHKVLIVSGPPGVGKTTLAKMISYHYLKDNWRFYAINSLDDGFSRIEDDTPTLFFFDDFLGRIELDRHSLIQRESAFAIFVRRIQKSVNARFILTTRAHIFEEARIFSDYIDDGRLQLAKYLLDVSAYSRRIRSHILFNHLTLSDLSQEHFAALLRDQWLKNIVDHKNYNPRVVASVSSECLDIVSATDYPSYIYHALDNPDLIWSKPFRALAMKCQNLLISLFFESQYGEDIDNLKEHYWRVHRNVCSAHAQGTRPTDFEDALSVLESGFISISNKRVRFVNPSLKDFLKAHLIDMELLKTLPTAARRAEWAGRLWQHVKEIYRTHPDMLAQFASLFQEFASIIHKTPTVKKKEEDDLEIFSDDLSISARSDLLLDWWEYSLDDNFIQQVISLLESRDLKDVTWRDSQSYPPLHWRVKNFIAEDHRLKKRLLECIEERFVAVVETGMSIDDLVSTIEKVDEYMEDAVSDVVQEALDEAVEYEFGEVGHASSHLEGKDELSEHMEHLEKLSALTGRYATPALEYVSQRLSEIEGTASQEVNMVFPPKSANDQEEFDDNALQSLFANLIDPKDEHP